MIEDPKHVPAKASMHNNNAWIECTIYIIINKGHKDMLYIST